VIIVFDSDHLVNDALAILLPSQVHNNIERFGDESVDGLVGQVDVGLQDADRETR
jgi:hypothetical protein